MPAKSFKNLYFKKMVEFKTEGRREESEKSEDIYTPVLQREKTPHQTSLMSSRFKKDKKEERWIHKLPYRISHFLVS